MNVLFANATHRWGGVKSWTLAVGRGLLAGGHRVEIVLRPNDPFGDAARDAGFTVRRLSYGPDWNPLAIAWFLRRLGSGRFDLVVTNVGKDNRTAAVAARLAGVPVVHRVGGPGDLKDRPAIRWAHRHLVNAILVPSVSTRNTLLRQNWIAPGQVTVIRTGIDLEAFRPGRGAGLLRHELRAAPEDILIGTTGQLTSVKGHAVLIEAFALLRRQGLPARLALIGAGPLLRPLAAQADRLGLTDRVHFLGFRRDLPDLLEDLDIAAHPSVEEGLPHSVIEFLAKGKPVVASRLDGIAEAMEDGRSGLLVTPERPVELAGALADLAAHPERRKAMGRAARERALAEFDVSKMTAQVEAFFTSVGRGEPHA